MIPVLYDSITNYKGLGVGKLGETISCKVHEEINGDYSLELTYPVTGEYYSDLMAGGVIEAVVPSVGGGLSSELFDLYKSSLPIDGVVTFYASHVSRRLARSINKGSVSSSGWRVYVGSNIKNAWEGSSPADWDGLTMNKASLTGATNKTPDSSYMVISAPKNALSLLIGESESAVKNFGGEFAFKMHGGGSKQLDIYWLGQRGSNKDASAIFGWNLTSLDRTIDRTGIFNAYLPYWTDGTDYVFGDVTQGSTPVSPVIATPFDCSFLFQTKPTKAELEAFATRSLDANNTMSGEQSISLDMLNASQIDPNANIELGDTIHAYWGKAGVNVDLRITSYDYDVIADQFTTLNLGTQQQEFVSTSSPSTAGSTANYQDAYVNGKLNVSGDMNVGGAVSGQGLANLLFGIGNVIATNTDCNSIVTEGKYTCPSVTVGGSLSNAPYSSAFGMLVLRVAEATRLVQIAMPNGTAITMKLRYYNGSTWTAWKTITPA